MLDNIKENIKEKIDGLEMIATNFVSTNSGMTFIKEKITELIKNGPNLPVQFDYLLVDISQNGGLIAICKKMNYLDQHKTDINKFILVMHQNAEKRYYIPLDWNYTKTYVVSIGFNDKEQLYAFCNDGTLFKIDILTNKAIKKINSAIFMDEGIVKAKLFENGFIALTTKGNIYYTPDIKNPKPIFIVNIKEQLGFSNEIDFLGIPSNKSRSGKFELIINNEKGNGILHIERQDSIDGNERNPSAKRVPISILVSEKLEKFVIENEKKTPKSEWETVDNNSEISEQKYTGVIGKVNAMCMSPSKNEIALYCAQNTTAFIIPTDLSELRRLDKLIFKVDKIDSDLDSDEINEHKALFSYNKKYQFLFCGNNAIALCGQRFIVLMNKQNEMLSFKVIEEKSMEAIAGDTLFKCITETDGIRYFSKEGIFLISEVCPELYNTCNPFSKNSGKQLINAYGAYLSKNADCDKQIREIAQDLPNAIKTLQTAAVNLYFTDENDENNLKELQMLLMKAAQYGKSFVQKGDFNYETFVTTCKDIRIINSLRNLKDTPRFLTYNEYLNGFDVTTSNYLKKMLRHNNFGFAFELYNFLGYDTDKIYQRFCIANIKKLRDDLDADRIFNELNRKLLECPNVSYITLAKKCIKHNKFNLAEKFLEQEKSIVVKVPQYLQLKNWSKALDLAIESNDRTVIKVVIDKIFKVEKEKQFIKIVGENKRAHKAVIEYLRMHDEEEKLRAYLGSKGDYEELLYMTLENFFKCKAIKDRREYLGEAKKYLNELKGNSNLDFYKAYLKDLEQSLKFKKNCIEPEKGIIPSNDISPFDNSIFECYKLGISKHYNWIEDENKNFNIGQKKLTYIRFKNLAEARRFVEIDEIVQKTGYKKLDISPLGVAKILYNVKNFEGAVKYIKEVTDSNEFDEKINLLKKMGKHQVALEIVMGDKKADKQMYIEGILKERPDLNKYLQELQNKPK